jgi:hypothetical protein
LNRHCDSQHTDQKTSSEQYHHTDIQDQNWNKLRDNCNIHDCLEDTKGLQGLELSDTNSNIDQLKCDVQDQNRGIWFHLQHTHPSSYKTCPPFQECKSEEVVEEFGLVQFESRKEQNTNQ